MVSEIQLIVIKWMIFVVFVITIVILMVFYIPTFVNNVFAQNVTAPPITTPTPVLTPTPTSPNPNLQYLPQKSYVQTFAPENGIPSSVPLQALPQVVVQPQPVQNQGGGILDQFGGVTGILALAGAAGVYVKSHLMNKVVKENAVQIVKSKEVEQSIAKQVYENMPDKGNSIQDKPEIQLETLKDNKEEATKTAAKA